MKIGICSFSPKIRSGSTGQTHLPVGAKWLLSLVGPVLWFAIGPITFLAPVGMDS